MGTKAADAPRAGDFQKTIRMSRKSRYLDGIDPNRGTGQFILAAIPLVGATGLVYSALTWGSAEPWDDRTRARVNKVYTYFASTIVGGAVIASTTARYLGTSRAIGLPLLLFSFAGSVGCMVMLFGGNTNNKPIWWVAFTVFEGLSFAGVFAAYPTALLKEAAMATASLTGGLTLIGAVAPSEDVLWMHGPLCALSFALFGISLSRIFFPSPLVNVLAVYGGIFIYSGRTLTDTSVMVEMAKTKPDGDFNAEVHAIGLYLDAAILFLKILQLLSGGGSSKKVSDDGVHVVIKPEAGSAQAYISDTMKSVEALRHR